MLHDLLVFSPFMVCVIMGIIHCMVSYRTNAFLALMIVIVTAGLFFMVDAYYSAIYGTSEVYIWFSLLYQIVAPSLIPVTMYYTVRLMKEVRYHPIQFLWIIIPSAMFAVSSLLMSIVGPKEIVEMTNDLNMNGLAALGKYKGQIVYRYYLWSEIVLRVVIALEMIYMILWMAVVSLKRKFKFKGYWRFLFKGESISVLQLQMVPMTIIGLVYLFKVFLFKNYLDAHLWITAILSLLVAFSAFFFDFFALFGARYTIHFNDFRFIVRFNYDRRRKQQIIEEMFDNLIEDADVETQRKIRGKIAVSAEVEAWEQENNTAKPSLADAIFNVASDSWSENSLMNRFQKLMKDAAFLTALLVSSPSNALSTSPST